MTNKFIGRTQELEIMDNFASGHQQVMLIYGRRRIGKTKLIEQALTGRPSLFFEGLENEPNRTQILNFIFQFEQQTKEVVSNRSKISTWSEAFAALEGYLRAHPGTTIVLDELQWMANRRSRMVAELKMVWERYLSKIPGTKLILSGSIASFMVKKVLRSKAFYGRIESVIHLQALKFNEAKEFFSNNDTQNALLAYLFVGGVPKYLEVIAAHASAVRGIAEECFSASGYLKNEFDRVFVSHFGKSANYRRIIESLKGRYFGLSRGELEELAGATGGGQLTQELFDLEQAGFLTCFVPFDKKGSSKFKRYVLSDPFLSFYLNFVDPDLATVDKSPDSFISATFNSPALVNWLGHSLELLVLQHRDRLAELLGFSGIRYSAGPYFRHNKGGKVKGVQLDLVFDRADRVYTVCEVKYLNAAVPVSVGNELNQKIYQITEFAGKNIQRVVVSNQSASGALKDSGLIGRVVGVAEF